VRNVILQTESDKSDRTFLAAGAAAEHAAALKIIKYADIMHSYDFVPIAMETLARGVPTH